ncbi:hypothetical protein N7530_009794 [Penicillium desertorum]|uniref:Uncharacterized protein n=1 Tax=Penicillium desertorum TaxID=1303715 RepID=A0A9W9WJ54_9EURO|nr:hypothetical protein N7530_009794 [Penicillium desertorum]
MIQAGISQAGTLEVIDHDGKCLIWSNDNYGCTGYSASFGLLDGADCSGRHPPLKLKIAINNSLELSEVVKGDRHELNVLNIDVCGREDGSRAAWIQVNHTGLVTFTNKNGNEASCVLNNGLNTGSWTPPTSTNTSSTSIPSTSIPSTSIPSTSIPSTSIPSTSIPSTSIPSTSTPSTSTPSTSTPSTIITVPPLTITSTAIVCVTE